MRKGGPLVVSLRRMGAFGMVPVLCWAQVGGGGSGSLAGQAQAQAQAQAQVQVQVQVQAVREARGASQGCRCPGGGSRSEGVGAGTFGKDEGGRAFVSVVLCVVGGKLSCRCCCHCRLGLGAKDLSLGAPARAQRKWQVPGRRLTFDASLKSVWCMGWLMAYGESQQGHHCPEAARTWFCRGLTAVKSLGSHPQRHTWTVPSPPHCLSWSPEERTATR